MFKNLLSFWKGKDFLLQVMEDFKIMLDEGQSMFEAVCARLTGEGPRTERTNLQDRQEDKRPAKGDTQVDCGASREHRHRRDPAVERSGLF